jgi:hypothetical protein
MIVQGRQQLQITHAKCKKRQVGLYFEVVLHSNMSYLGFKERNKSEPAPGSSCVVLQHRIYRYQNAHKTFILFRLCFNLMIFRMRGFRIPVDPTIIYKCKR